MKKYGIGNSMIMIVLITLTIVVCYPIIFIIVGSLKSNGELLRNLSPVFYETEGYASWSLLPLEPTLRAYVELLLDSPKFFVMFWNSVKITMGILLGQVIVSVPAAWALARYRFPCAKVIYILYIVLMMLPFQVLMLSNYFVLEQLNLLDTLRGIILPSIFSTFPIFIMKNAFTSVPEVLLESGRLDGASEVQLFFSIGIPISMPGIISMVMVGVIESWNMIEQPLNFLKDKTKWPLSLFLPAITIEGVRFAFVVAMIMLIPIMLLFFIGKKYLEEGIAMITLK
jgi:ABC-type sugar transport system, permease component